MAKKKTNGAVSVAVVADPLDIPEYLKRGKDNSRPTWLQGEGKACFVLTPAKQAEKTRDEQVKEEVTKEYQAQRELRWKNRVAKRKSTPKDLTGLVWDASRNRFVVEGQLNIEKAIKQSVSENPTALYNEMAGELKIEPIKAKDAKKIDVAAQCKELWDALQLRKRGLVTNGKTKARTVRAPRLPRAPGEKRPAKRVIPETAKLKILVKPNPFSQKSGNRYATYELVKKSKTYGEFLKKGGDVATFARILGFKTIAIEGESK